MDCLFSDFSSPYSSSNDADGSLISGRNELSLKVFDSVLVLSHDWPGKLVDEVGSASAGDISSVPFVSSSVVPVNMVSEVFGLKILWSSSSNPCLLSSDV
jgi:hypothetical protein